MVGNNNNRGPRPSPAPTPKGAPVPFPAAIPMPNSVPAFGRLITPTLTNATTIVGVARKT